MTAGLLGSDVERLRDLARQLDAASQKVAGVGSQVAGRVTQLSWDGPDRKHFVANDLARVRTSLRTACTELTRLGSLVRKQADEQEATSAELGAVGVPGFGGDPFDALFGGTGGVPGTIDDQIADTRRGMESDLDAARKHLAELKEQRKHAGGIGNWIADHNAFDESESEKLDRQIREEAKKVERLEKLLEDPSRQFLKVDASGDGRIIEVYGDLSKADHVAIHIPGMSTSMDSYTGGNGHTDANELWKKLDGWTQGSGEHVAVISFLDYDAPDGFEDWKHLEKNARAGLEAAGEGLAEKGADNLRSLVSDLNRQGVDSSKITVVAHSYGSVVTGLALRDGLDVERAVVIGSPGLGSGIDSYEDLHTDADLWVGASKSDPVPYTSIAGAHGTSPAAGGYGGTLFSTEGSGGHSEYFEGESLNNIGGIVMGDFD